MDTIKNSNLSTELIAQWHPTLNGDLKPENVTTKSKNKIWWLCEKGHEYLQPVITKVSGTGKCLVCMGKIIVPNVNDLQTRHPLIAAEWHPAMNGEIKTSTISPGSKKNFWWICDKGHTWQSSVEKRVYGQTKCHYCTNQKILKGFNDLKTTHPLLANQWHPTKNGELKPEQIFAGSNKKIWWMCDKKHEWLAASNDRKRGTNCPYCTNQKILKGFNDLTTTHPHIASQWHPTKNGELLPTQVIAGSIRKVWWLDTQNHEYYSAIAEYVKSGNGCLKCAIKVGSTKKSTPKNGNDLKSINPQYVSEWHPTKNGNLTPETIIAGTAKRIYWLCNKGHEWNTKLSDRLFYQTNCPTCAQSFSVSKAENQIYDYLTSLGLKVEQSNRTILNGKEIDLWIPAKNVGIEYNGLYWHNENSKKSKNYHKEKYVIAKNKGIKLIQIWEDDWNQKKNIVKKSLAHKLGVAETEKIFARKTKIVNLTTQEAQKFLQENHIQGYASGSYYLGLQNSQNETEALMVLKKEQKNTLNIIRYATRNIVIGGFTKLLNYSTKTYKPNKYITFADHTISDGELYEKNGFIAEKVLPPDYMYVIKQQRKHKFGYRIKRFKNDPNLKYVEGYTETQLAKHNNISRIWDAGKTRYILNVKNK